MPEVYSTYGFLERLCVCDDIEKVGLLANIQMDEHYLQMMSDERNDIGPILFGDLERDEIVDELADQIDEDDLVMRYNWADSP